MDQTIVVSLDPKHYEILSMLSEAWGKSPSDILKLVCEKALDSAAKHMGEKKCQDF